MTKREKALGIAMAMYFISLLLILVMMLISIFTNTEQWLIFIYAFMVIFIIGYLIIVIMKIFTYDYECPICKKKKRMSFGEAIFSKRGDNTRILKCKNCNEKQNMNRVPR